MPLFLPFLKKSGYDSPKSCSLWQLALHKMMYSLLLDCQWGRPWPNCQGMVGVHILQRDCLSFRGLFAKAILGQSFISYRHLGREEGGSKSAASCV